MSVGGDAWVVGGEMAMCEGAGGKNKARANENGRWAAKRQKWER